MRTVTNDRRRVDDRRTISRRVTDLPRRDHVARFLLALDRILDQFSMESCENHEWATMRYRNRIAAAIADYQCRRHE